jgi:site-specific DNA-methyltransferase (adenine-specific)
MESNKLYCDNSLELIETLDQSPDLVILHPPDIFDTTYDWPEYVGFLKEIYLKCWNKLGENGVLVSCTTDRKHKGIMSKHFEIMKFMEGQRLLNYKIWVKTLKANLFIPTFAHILVYAKGKAGNNQYPEFRPDVWCIDQEKVAGYPGKDNFPGELARRIIVNYTNENDLVFDPFVGSGTSCKVAKDLKRYYIGFDISQEFITLAEKRIESQT